jgi:hypothetical protein
MTNPPSDDAIAKLNEAHTNEVLQIHAAYFELIETLYNIALGLAIKVDAAAKKENRKLDLQHKMKEGEAKLIAMNKNLVPGFISKRLLQTGAIQDSDKQKQ